MGLFNDVKSRREYIKLAVSYLNHHEIFRKLFNLCKKYIHRNPAVFNIAHLTYVLPKENEFYPGCDVMDFLNIQDWGRVISFSYLCLLIFQKLSILPKFNNGFESYFKSF